MGVKALPTMSDISQQIAALRKDVATLTAIVLKDKIGADWLDEPTAASMCGYSCEYFRRQVKEGRANWSMIHHRQNGKVIQYNRKSVEKFLKATSTLT